MRNLVPRATSLSKVMQGIANPRSNLAQSHYSNFFTIKKRVWETLSMTWFFMSRGDRIRTCDLVLPKHSAFCLRLILITNISD